MNYIDKTIGKWKNESLPAYKPESKNSVYSTFSYVESVAANDLIELYSKIGGMEEMDEEHFRLWSLQEVKEEFDCTMQQTNNEKKFVTNFGVQFADHLLNSWVYRVKAVDANNSHVFLDAFDSSEPTLIAKSLHEFFEMFYKDPDSIL